MLLSEDTYFCLADFASYARARAEATRQYLDPEGWARKSLLNVARAGRFSSDRTIREYAHEIWSVSSVPADG